MRRFAVVAVVLLSLGTSAIASKVTGVSPTDVGSGGGVLINIFGDDFSLDPFSFGTGNANKGNDVSFVGGGQSYICDIHPNGCTKIQIQCYTRKGIPVDTDLMVRVKVDGQNVTDICSGCKIRARNWLTPTLDSIEPQSGKPGEIILTMHGTIMTTRFGSNTQTSTNGVDQKLLRLYSPQSCDPFQEKDTFYQLDLDDPTSKYGTVQCKPEGTFVGSVKPVLFIEPPYGRSVIDKTLIHISRTGEPYAVQTYSDIQSMSPVTGSENGGTEVTVHGLYYDTGPENSTYSAARVIVEDLECEITHVERDEYITFVVPAKPVTTATWYTGNRGVLVESFNSPSFSTYDGALASVEAPSSVTWRDETRYCAPLTNTWTRMRFVFEAPTSGLWDFYIKADENAKLVVDDGASGESTGGWAYAGSITLTAGQRVPATVVGQPGTGTESCTTVRVLDRDTTVSPELTGKSLPELQTIKISSKAENENFTLKFSGFSSAPLTNDQQKICITGGSSKFRLGLHGAYTTSVDLTIIADVEMALNKLPFKNADDSFTVTESDGNCILVTLNSKRGNLPHILTKPMSGVTVEKITPGRADNVNFAFQINDVTSPLIKYNSTDKPGFAIKIKEALETMFGVQCPARFLTGGTLYEGFEEGPTKFGSATAEKPAFCGRYSCKNCQNLFPVPQGSVSTLLLSLNKWFCFAASGHTNDGIRLKFKDRDDNLKQAWFTMTNINMDGDWSYKCMDIHDAFKTRWPTGTAAFSLYDAYIYNDDGDFLIDELFFGQASPVKTLPMVTDFAGLRMGPAYPNTAYMTTIDSITVSYDETNDQYDVSVAPFDCGYDFKLLTLAGSTVTDGSDLAGSNSVTSTLDGRSGAMVTTRTNSASKPLKGTVSLTYNGATSGAIEVFNSTDEKFKAIMEGTLDIGTLTITRTEDSTCANMEIVVEFSDSPGDKPLMTITDALIWPPGIDTTAEVVAKRDGHMNYEPITGDLVSTWHAEPQVRVFINDVPTKCEMTNHQCTYTWSIDATPTVTSTDITEGNQGDVLTITGTLFSTTAADNMVTIGDIPCEVTSSTVTEIVCTVGNGPLNTYPVKVTVAGKGIASGTADFTYRADASSLQPLSSTLGGRVTVTLTGEGLSEDSVIMFGSSECVKTGSEIPTEIFCEVPPFTDLSVTSDQTVTVTVTIGNSQLPTTFQFTYTYVNTEITAVTHDALTVHGGQTITITGTNMGTEGKVLIGDTELTVNSRTNTEIQAVTPEGIPAGRDQDLLVFTGTTGIILQASSIPKVDIILEVTNVTPLVGSLYGGTVLTLTGAGFKDVTDAVEVTVGDYSCAVIDVQNTVIKCEIEDTAKTHEVNNSGTTGQGYPYSYSQKIVNAQQGDNVRFTLTRPEYIDALFSVREIETLDATEDKVGGISSGAENKEVNFVQRFTELRDHYFWTNIESYSISLRMTVKVSPRTATKESITVKVSGQEATYDITSGQSDPTDNSGCTIATTDIAESVPESLPDPDPTKFNFKFTISRSPIVNTVTLTAASAVERSILITTPLTFTGTGFSANDCANEAEIGGCRCTVTGSSTTSFTCTPDASCQYETGIYQEVSLKVNQYGDALINKEKQIERSVAFIPLVTGLAPTSGSSQGGTAVTVTGTGFSDDEDQVQVTFGGFAADCTQFELTQLVCTSPFKSTSGPTAVDVKIGGVSAICNPAVVCTYSYDSSITPTISSVTPSEVASSTTLTFTGDKLGNDASKLTIAVGGEPCSAVAIVTANTEVSCQINALPAGDNDIKCKVADVGVALTDVTVSGVATATLSPAVGSTNGYTEVSITGNGFVEDGLTIQASGTDICETVVVESLTKITCMTKAHAAGDVEIIVTSNNVAYPALNYQFSEASTPVIDSISPTSGAVGTTLTITGQNFGTVAGDLNVYIGDAECTGISVSGNDITCTTGAQSSGDYDVTVYVTGKGKSNSNTFTYELTVTSIAPVSGDSGGNQFLTVTGNGFTESMEVKVCDEVCEFHALVSSSEYVCVTPAGTAGACDVTVTEGSATPITVTQQYTYAANVSPKVTKIEPRSGTTLGNTAVTITGTGFSNAMGDVSVEIDGVTCGVTSSTVTEIVCTTGSHTGTKLKAGVVVSVSGQRANAASGILQYNYADGWGSIGTWGNLPVPQAGDFVVIPEGQTILLDTDTEVLEMLLIQGNLIFDEQDVTLRAKRILITNNGSLQVGSEEEPFLHKAVIELVGHPRETGLPIYGTKLLGVRNGTLDLHGRDHVKTWTLLDATAAAGSSTITVEDEVDWEVDDEIVIASTGGHLSFDQNEKRKITAISGTQLTLDKPLVYEHLGNTETYTHKDGSTVEMKFKAEVGLLTRNVVVRGSADEAWNQPIEKCEKGFDPAEFATQTCFQGRFGEEKGTDQFGVQIMIHQPGKANGQIAVAHFSNVEVTHAGQAFRLGRYPIHFHLNGNMDKSYVTKCSIHETFNRAINIHGSHNINISNNVVYNVMGGALFLEDGMETGNVFVENICIFSKSSTSLLNDDITPACFWITFANNTYVRNHAVAGTHFAFWLRMHEHPDGPSFTTDICPRRVPIRQFESNVAHSFGWFGIWIFQEYYPAVDGLCDASKGHAKAVVKDFVSWNNQKGAEFVTVGAVHMEGGILIQNDLAGFEMKMGKNGQRRTDKSTIVNGTFIAGKADSVDNQNEDGTTVSGVVFPFSDSFQVHDTKFYNFEETGTYAFHSTRIDGTCSDNCGGWNFQTSGLAFEKVTDRLKFSWGQEAVIEDLDGTLCNTNTEQKILPQRGDAWPTECTETCSAYLSDDSIPALVCPSSKKFHRIGFDNPNPSSLNGKNMLLSNSFGSTYAGWRDHRVKNKDGWAAILVDGETTLIEFENAETMTNISGTGRSSDYDPGDCVIIKVKVQEQPDVVSLDHGASSRPISDEPFTCSTPDLLNGNWSYADGHISIAVVNNGDTNTDIDFNLKITKCYFENCERPPDPGTIPPPEGRPDVYQEWTQDIWEQGTGANQMVASKDDFTGSGPPTEGQDVLIETDMWVLITRYNVPDLGTVTIKGGLEIDYEFAYDYVLRAKYIIILGGRFHIGWLNNNMVLPTVQLTLQGTKDSPWPSGIEGYPVSNMGIGVYGGFEVHGRNVGKSWTKLAQTVSTGDNTLLVRTAADISEWRADDRIIVTTTSSNKAETEEVEIQSINYASGTITTKSSFRFRHTGGIEEVNGVEIDLGAAIGLVDRTVSIQGEVTEGDAWGGRILVSVTAFDGNLQTGYARLHDALFLNMGQDGYIEPTDPRYAIAYVDTGSYSEIKPSEIYRCAFYDLYNTAFGAFGADDFVFKDNFVYKALGNGIQTTSDNTTFDHNLIASTQWTGSYDGRNEAHTTRFESALDAFESSGLNLRNNYIVGSERIGYHVPGVDCDETEIMYENNVAVSNIMGVGILPKDMLSNTCVHLYGFTVFKNYDFGIYYHNTPSLIASNNMYVDENFALFPMVIGPDPLSHTIGEEVVEVRDSIFIGTSSLSNCAAETAASGAYLDLSSDHRSSRGPSSERLYVMMAVFTGGSNNCPVKPCNKIMSYNAIAGEMKVYDVTFVNFDGAKSGCQAAFAVSTLKGNDDANHPVLIERITLINTQKPYLLLIHRPNVGKINPADCVDMDCDALKKALVKDLDGSFMGSIGSFIPESEWEWGGDPRRGLGDYRIPKDSLTTVSGEVVTADVMAPSGRGIVRTDACVYTQISNNRAAYYWCPGLDYEMLLIESLDDDTEMRRLSPVAIFSGGYVDLINGPQDHGWCNGYTCQKRISTFIGMVLPTTNDNLVAYVYFSSTQPDKIRFAMIRADSDQCVVVVLYYLNPNRIDIYTDNGNTYVLPKNGEEDASGNFKLKIEKGVDYRPTCADPHGANFIDRVSRQLHFVVKGGTKTIILKRANVVIVAFGLPAINEDDFFNDDKIIVNLAALLGITPDKIRVVNVVAISARRRRRSTGTTVTLEIGDGPSESADEDTDPVTDLGSALMNACQEGTIGLSLGEETNCDQIVLGETYYTPAQPDDLRFHEHGSPQHEGVPFAVQPKIRAYDTDGEVIEHLGIEESPWEITATLRSCVPACGHANAVLSGTVTIQSSQGWFNFTDLQISHKGDGYIIDFEITSPSGTNLTVASEAFSVDGLPMTAGVYSMTSGDIPQGSAFSLTLDLRDSSTDIAIPDVTWRDHTAFDATCRLVVASETGELSGTLSKTFDLATGRATFDMSFSGYGLIYISCLVESTPEEFNFTSFHKVFVLGSHQAGIPSEASETIVVRFNLDYDTTLPTEAAAAQLEQATIEVFTMLYPDVVIRQTSLGRGSILVTFTIEGQSVNVTTTKQDICSQISSGLTVTVGGSTLTLDSYMTVDGTNYYATCGAEEDDDEGLHPAYIALIAVLCVLVVGAIVFVLVWRFMIKPKSKTHGLRHFTVHEYADNGRTVFLGTQNQKIQDILYKQKGGNTEFRPNSTAPITTLYDETPGYLSIRKSPLPPTAFEDGARSLTPTGS